jgi:hypothetical protein
VKVRSLSIVFAALGIFGLVIGAVDSNPKWLISGAILVGACLITWAIQNKTIV